LMRTAYQVMRRNYTKQMNAVFADISKSLTEAYAQVFDVTNENFSVVPPTLPDLPPPVTIAQTIVLDVKTSWWKRWWGGRKGYTAFSDGFRELIEAETSKMVDDLKVGQTDEIRAMAKQVLADFLDEQLGVLDDICEKAQVSIEDLHGLFGVTSQEEREELFEIIFEELEMDVEMMGDAA